MDRGLLLYTSADRRASSLDYRGGRQVAHLSELPHFEGFRSWWISRRIRVTIRDEGAGSYDARLLLSRPSRAGLLTRP